MAKRRIETNMLRATGLFAALTALSGLAFPAALLGLAEALLPEAAHGSLIRRGGVVIGSKWIGQTFDAPKYFWGRPSATAPDPYNAVASGGSNLGPLHPDLLKVPKARLAVLSAGMSGDPVPIDLLTASGSGLDPHISVAGALFQVPRVAAARGLPPEQVRALVAAHLEEPVLGFLGDARINVLELNVALDEGRQH